MDTPIYDITSNEMLNADLCPIAFNTNAVYRNWHKKRHFIKSNRAAEATTAISDIADKRISKRRLSLCDCYWIRYSYDSDKTFAEVSPYHTPYIDYHLSWGIQGSVPDATIGGSFPKIWGKVDGVSAMNKIIMDNMVRNEMAALALAHKLNIDANLAWARVGGKLITSREFHPSQFTEGNEIFIKNMTSPKQMLLPLSWSTPSNARVSRGHNIVQMRLAFKNIWEAEAATDFIVRTILFDAIVSNDDRRTNMSNWGYFKDAETGVCTPAPLYDFNLAHLNQNTMYLPRIIEAFKGASKDSKMYSAIAREYLLSWEEGVKDFGAGKWVENWEALVCNI
jgi:hypothetical protein